MITKITIIIALLALAHSSQDPFAPHPGTGFEGFYARNQLPDGSTLVVIFGWVKNALSQPNMLHVSYTPSTLSTSSFSSFKHEFFPNDYSVEELSESSDGQQSFIVTMSNYGAMKVTPEIVTFNFNSSEANLDIQLNLTNRTAWNPENPLAGPMGPLAPLSPLLPQTWFVYSTHSIASFVVSHAGETLKGKAISHLEKNWGVSFPKGWIWSQAFASDGSKGSIALAGGPAIGAVQAYLIGYRSKNLSWDFRPPMASGLGPLSPYLQVTHDSTTGTVNITVQAILRKLVIQIEAPPASFIAMAAPLKDGFVDNFAFESFKGRTFVQAWQRTLPLESWKFVEEGYFGVAENGAHCAALEFGGSYYEKLGQRQAEVVA